MNWTLWATCSMRVATGAEYGVPAECPRCPRAYNAVDGGRWERREERKWMYQATSPGFPGTKRITRGEVPAVAAADDGQCRRS